MKTYKAFRLKQDETIGSRLWPIVVETDAGTWREIAAQAAQEMSNLAPGDRVICMTTDSPSSLWIETVKSVEQITTRQVTFV